MGAATLFPCLRRMKKDPRIVPSEAWVQRSWSQTLWGNALHGQPEPEATPVSVAKEVSIKIKGLDPRDTWTARVNHCNGFGHFHHSKGSDGTNVQSQEELLSLGREWVHSSGFHPGCTWESFRKSGRLGPTPNILISLVYKWPGP